MAFQELFTFGEVVFDDFSSLYDTDRIQLVFHPKRKEMTENDWLELGLGEDMFYWRYRDYKLVIGFLGPNQGILKIELAYCDDWDEIEKVVIESNDWNNPALDRAAIAWGNPIKSVVCKSKEDVTKTVKEMLEYVKEHSER